MDLSVCNIPMHIYVHTCPENQSRNMGTASMTCSLEYGVTSGSRHRYHRKYYREGGWKEIRRRLGKGRKKEGREGGKRRKSD